eukprot:CAMPEP_0113675600 /NCGR_PEP_ID=MMETSP0038_2-20120614/8117_1 /TAXON_ID=2898 /ORGANISM="Cryptomonas paramecium" /LENGTH=30 /DNA_ID=CAMNT_0000592415 /DNA_START=154 /DNA_END=246 /DNA_ORIENTATION=- /assembly_acc=CAM_ASM_000170
MKCKEVDCHHEASKPQSGSRLPPSRLKAID